VKKGGEGVVSPPVEIKVNGGGGVISSPNMEIDMNGGSSFLLALKSQ